MIRITLIAVAALATIATASSALAQAGAPVRTLNPSTSAEAPIVIAERKAASSASSVAKLAKRGYVAPAPLGW